MASSSARPHRQARSGVSYRDPYYDYEDDFFFCRRRRSSPSPAIAITSKKSKDFQHASKKNLALKPAKNRANAKERAEAVQLQRAINESLSQRSSEANVQLQRAVHEILPDRSADIATSVLDHEKSMVDCMDEHVLKTLFDNKRISMDRVDESAHCDCVAFQCLLDVATEAVLESTMDADELQDTRETGFIQQNEGDQIMEPSAGILRKGKMIEPSVGMLCNGEMIKDSTSDEMNEELGKCKDYTLDITKDEINVCDEGNSDSYTELEEGSSEQVDTENGSSDLSDESGCQRRRPVKLQQKAIKDAVKDNVFPVQVKKARSARPLLKLDALSSENCQKSVSIPCKPSAKAPGGKENVLASTSIESSKNTGSNGKQQIAAKGGAAKKSCESVENLNLLKSHVFDLVSAGQQGVPVQSPTLLHRRVIGLSRRHRPPPLHPYLAKRDR